MICCDGKVVCGCADPRASHVLGDIAEASLPEIWHGAAATALRRAFLKGAPPRYCLDCELCEIVQRLPAATDPSTTPGPFELYVEPTVRCNISCANTTCSRESGIYETRSRPFLEPADLDRALAGLRQPLQRVLIYNYGEPFLHPRIMEIIRIVRRHQPGAWLATSTNGLLLHGKAREELLKAGLDEIIFSIDGVDQAGYERYRRGGDFDLAFGNMRELAAERKKAGLGRPYIIWRYILFRWNDREEEMATAQRMAAEIGVDRFCFEISDYPEDAVSRRVVPGSVAYEQYRHLIWGQARFTMNRRLELLRMKRVTRRSGTIGFRIRARNTGRLRWEHTTPYGIRHVALGVSLYDRHGGLISLDHAHVPLVADVEPGGEIVIQGAVPAPDRPGLYRLGFDMVYEAVAWFSELSSDNPRREMARVLVL
ncbi:radical SAM protein [bacterium]|nr:radical SAM protein [candidate division CSSED10-310 bacterium]